MTMDAYRGVYMLQEKVSRNKHRVDVAKFDPATDITGGTTSLSVAGGPSPGQCRTGVVVVAACTMVGRQPSGAVSNCGTFIHRAGQLLAAMKQRYPLSVQAFPARRCGTMTENAFKSFSE